MIIKNFCIVVGICFLASSLFLVEACSVANSSAQTSNQTSNIPAIVRKVDKPNPDLNERVYSSKTIVLDNEILKDLDCSNSNGFNLVEVENHHDDEGISSYDLDILVNGKATIKIEMPTGFEVKNFELVSTKKNKNGFQMKTGWGGSLHYYEVSFDFRCKENNFYLYKVKKDSFSTTNSNSGNFLDKKETKVVGIEPNILIQNFVITDYL